MEAIKQEFDRCVAVGSGLFAERIAAKFDEVHDRDGRREAWRAKSRKAIHDATPLCAKGSLAGESIEILIYKTRIGIMMGVYFLYISCNLANPLVSVTSDSSRVLQQWQVIFPHLPHFSGNAGYEICIYRNSADPIYRYAKRQGGDGRCLVSKNKCVF